MIFFRRVGTVSSTLDECDALIPVSITMLTQASSPGVDIYLCAKPNEPAILFCASSNKVDVAHVERLQGEGVTKLYIHVDDRDKYQDYLRSTWQELLMDERQPLLGRVSVMSEVIRDVLKEQFSVGTTESIVESCKEFGACTAEVLGREPVILKELARVLHHDYGTFTHSANVAAYAVLLGRALGLSRYELEELAVGGLLHDLGKLEIDDRVLNKPGKLNDEEIREIRNHPTRGLQRVADRTDLSFGQFMMIYQHHERCNGSGYPVGCNTEEIHPWGRLCAIVDVYEALTSYRPYRPALSHQTALTILERGRGIEFDEEMLSCWHRLMLA
jgi:HD-GYP domain-containing protein (c-di-GMP phosphodiesterase class II)